MAIFLWSELTHGQSIAFDPNVDVLRFDDAGISAAEVHVAQFPDGVTDDISFSFGPFPDWKSVRLQTSSLTITRNNVVFDNGSQLLIGDDSTGTTGDPGDNILTSGSGHDRLIGGAGADTLNGNDGNDVFQISIDRSGATPAYGNDTLNGGNGVDSMFYSVTRGRGVQVNFATGQATGGDDLGSVLTLNSIEWVDGTQYDDTFVGSGANEFFQGFDGSETIDGGAGTDVVLFHDPRERFAVATQADGSIRVTDLGIGIGGTDTLRNVEVLRFADQDMAVTGNQLPVVTPFGARHSLAVGQSVPVSAMFTASDPDGNSTITAYRFFEDSTGGGRLHVSGTPQTEQQYFDVAAAQLGSVTYVGSAAGTDQLRVQAFDGIDWSNRTTWLVETTPSTSGGGGSSRPVISGPASRTVALNSPISFASFLTVADADGSPIARFEVRDGNAAAGTAELYVNNAMQGQGATVQSNTGALADVYARSASTNATDTIQIRAHDGTDWGAWFSFNLVSGSGSTGGGGGGGGSRPVITGPASQSVALNSPLSFGSFLTVADADGSPITRFAVRDVNATAGSAELYVNSAMQGQGASVESNSGALANIYVRSASMNATDSIQIRAHDGTDWGNWFSFNVVSSSESTGGGGDGGGSRPVITGPASQTVALNSPVQFSSFLTVADADGSPINRFAVRDGNAAAGSAELYLNSAMQGQGVTVESNDGVLANIYARSASGNNTDRIEIAAYDGTGWGNWFSFNLVSGSGSTGGGGTGGSRPVITGPASHTVQANSPVQFSSFLTVADADGSAITKFEVRDVNATAGSAELYVNSAMQGQGADVESNNGSLSTIYARSASMNATDGMQIRAHDGTNWGNWFNFNLVTTLAS